MSDIPNYDIGELSDLNPVAPSAPSLTERAGMVVPSFDTMSVDLPAIVGSPFGAAPRAPKVVSRLPDYQKALTNKYTKLGPIMAQVPEAIRNAIIDFDARKVAQGSPPLTEEQTIKAIQTAINNQTATPKPDRSIGNVPGNFLGDLGNMLKSIPRIPGAIVKEATSIPSIGSSIAKSQSEGMNGLAALANAPGVRMLPGAYIAGNLANGASGVAELARHPLFTALDILPGVSKAAGMTATGKALTAMAAPTGVKPNILRGLMTNTLDEGGNLVRNRAGQAVDRARDTTRAGQGIDAMFGARNRVIAREANRLSFEAHAKAIGLTDDGSELLAIIRDGNKLNDKYAALDAGMFTPERRAELARAATLDELTGLQPMELAYVNEARHTARRFGEYLADRDELGKVLDPANGATEFYPKSIADSINEARTQAEHGRRMNALTKDYLDPGRRTADDLNAQLVETVGRKDVRETRALLHVMTAHGFDVTPMKGTLSRIERRKSTWDDFATQAKQLPMQPVRPPIKMSEIARTLAPHRTDPMVKSLVDAIADGNTKRITKAFNALNTRSKFKIPALDDPAFFAAIRDTREMLSFHNSTGRRYSDRFLDRYERRAAKLYEDNAPARFGPRIGEESTGRTVRELRKRQDGFLSRPATAEEAAQLTTYTLQRRWQDVAPMIGGDAKTVLDVYRGIENEVARTWQGMRDAGIDPVFVHSTSAGRARAASRPKIGPVPNTLSQTRERALDFSPGVNDLGISLSHQGAEILTRMGSEQFIDFTIRKYGVTEADLRSTFADRAAADVADNPLLDFDGHLQEYMRRGYERFNPDTEGYSWGGVSLDKYRQDTWYIPKSIAANLKEMHSPRSVLGGVLDPINKTFRYSVIALSPRTQLYNILGGATMLLGQTGPGSLRYFREAREMVKNPELIANETMRAIVGTQRSVFSDLDNLETSKFGAAKYEVMKGRTLGRLFNESRAIGAAKNLANKSLDFNGFIDDVYRMMAFKHGEASALKEGISPEVAARAGEELARKTMMDWTSMTPFERSIMKSVIPFYGFMSHALRYVFRYPVDHPMRAEMLAKFAQSEEDDLGALPNTFLGSLFVGGQNKRGKQNALSLASVNPFGDTANMLTLSGFLSATNPVVQTILESVGVTRGSAELYPSLRYDAESGRLAGVHVNPLMAFTENLIPQSRLVTSLLGVNTDFNEMARNNPAAANRSLASSVGLPIAWRNYNVPQEQIRNELSIQKSANDVKNDALRTGNWSEAMRYPSLRAYYDAVKSLPPEVLATFTPPEQSAISAQLNELVRTAGPVTPATYAGGI